MTWYVLLKKYLTKIKVSCSMKYQVTGLAHLNTGYGKILNYVIDWLMFDVFVQNCKIGDGEEPLCIRGN